MKKKLKRLYWTVVFALTRSDVCAKHWVIKTRHGYKTRVEAGFPATFRTLDCGICEDERTAAVEKAQQETEERQHRQAREFEEALNRLREEYLNA